MTDDEDRRTCKIVIGGSCDAPANGSRSARATCHACGEPVCTSPWCSRRRGWPTVVRRICRDCDEHDGLYADPAGRLRVDRRLARQQEATASWL